MKDISVIVPAYNAELYLVDCLNSLINQTKKEIEIIIVNDGSTDRTEDIAKRYEAKYPDKIQVVSQKNQGQSVARNNGIKIATGKYIGFVDCDDIISKNMYEKLYTKAIEQDYDVVACNVNVQYPNKNVLVNSGVKFESVDLSKNERNKLLQNMYAVVWNKIYKKDIFKNKDLLYEPGIWFEDVLFLYKLIPYIKNIGYIDDVLYTYIQRKTSVTYTYTEKLLDINKMLNLLVEFYEKNKLYDDYRDELEYIYARYMLATYIKRLAKSKDKEKFDKGVEFALEQVNEKFPVYKKNKYLQNGKKAFYIRHFNKFFANMIYKLEKDKMN